MIKRRDTGSESVQSVYNLANRDIKLFSILLIKEYKVKGLLTA